MLQCSRWYATANKGEILVDKEKCIPELCFTSVGSLNTFSDGFYLVQNKGGEMFLHTRNTLATTSVSIIALGSS